MRNEISTFIYLVMDATASSFSPEILLTKRIKSTLEKAVVCKCITDQLRDECDQILLSNTSAVRTKVIRDVYHTLQRDGQKVSLHEIVEDADLVPQSVVLPPRNPELEARIQKLRREEENKEYRRMTQNVDHMVKGKTLTFGQEVKSLNRQMVAIFNFVLTVIAGFAFGYKGTEFAVGQIFPMQMMNGLIAGTVVFFADLYFLMKYGPL